MPVKISSSTSISSESFEFISAIPGDFDAFSFLELVDFTFLTSSLFFHHRFPSPLSLCQKTQETLVLFCFSNLKAFYFWATFLCP